MIEWGETPEPEEGVAFQDLSPDQQKVVLDFVGLQVLQAQQLKVVDQTGYRWDPGVKVYFNDQKPESERYLETLTEGAPLDYANADIFWGEVAAPAEGTPFAQLSAEQKAAVATSLRYDLLEGDWYYNPDASGDQRLVRELVTGPAPDYSNATLWVGASEPGEEVPWTALDDAQKEAVVRHLGYSEFTGTVYFNPGADAAEQWREAFIEGTGTNADYAFEDIDWGLNAPDPDAAFEDLDDQQKRRVALHLGYDEYRGVVYFKADEPASSRFALSFTEGEDYQNDQVTWSELVAVPAADAAFEDLSLAQKRYVADRKSVV